MIEENEEIPIFDHDTHILKTAMCMFMNVTDPKDFFNFLPSDTEVNTHTHILIDKKIRYVNINKLLNYHY